MQVRKIKISDAQSVLDLMYQLDSESKFMMLEEGERTTTLEQQVKSLESFNQSGSKVMFVIQDGHEICGFVAGVGGTYRRNRHSMHCIMGTKRNSLIVDGQYVDEFYMSKLLHI